MVWRINRIRNMYNLPGDVFFQKTNALFNIHTTDYNVFDVYYLWRVGVNIFNIDRTVHDEDFFNNVVSKIQKAREYNAMGHYRPIGAAVTLSATKHIAIGEEISEIVDVIILKDVETKDHIIEFRRKNQKLTTKPILVWLSKYGLGDINLIIKMSDGVVLDFYNQDKIIQEICRVFLRQCRQMHKPVIVFRPALIETYLDKHRELLPIATELVELNPDGLLLEDDRDAEIAKDAVYNILTAMYFAEQRRTDIVDEKEEYFRMRSELMVPVTPPLSVALGASLMALYCDAKIIMVFTKSGRSARWISCAAPPCMVLAVTTRPSTSRSLHVYRKVMPLLYDEPSAANWLAEWRNRVHFGIAFCMKIGLLFNGAKLVVLSPDDSGDGYCNCVQIVSVPFDTFKAVTC